LRYLLVGLGSIGKRHVRLLRTLDADARIAAWRRGDSGHEPAEGIDQVMLEEGSLDAWRPDAAVVATPAALHLPAALACARRGVPLFIEKPLADRLDGLDELAELCAGQRLVVMVGYCLRFHPAVAALTQAARAGRIGRVLSLRAEVGQYLPDWRPGQDYRTGVSARADLGGGAVLELSHELDYARWLAGEVRAVRAWTGSISNLHLGVEDVAEILLEFEGGAVGSIHLDMVERWPHRSCRVIGTDGTLEWNAGEQRVRVFTPAAGWQKLLEGPVDPDAMYLAELRHFLDCVRTGERPLIDLGEGRRVLEIALAAKQAAALNRGVAV